MTAQRNFILGDHWIYYKIYTGVKTADTILTGTIKPLAEQLMVYKIIDKWFFIRYNDPKSHIRVRFHLKNKEKVVKLIEPMYKMLTPLMEQFLISKVQTDTYCREYERYGQSTMDLSETLFFNDSQMIVNMLDMIDGDEGEELRWLFGIRSIDTLLDDFNYTLDKKHVLLEKLKDSFGKEFGMNRELKSQIDKKFRDKRKNIENILDTKQDQNQEIFPLLQLIYNRSKMNTSFIQEILRINKNNGLKTDINSLISSYIHMHCNRLFKSKQRLHELVLYDFLYRYYRSAIARFRNK